MIQSGGSDSINKKRRELLQTLLIVAGIIGAVGPYSSPVVLRDLIIFIFLAVILYTYLMRDRGPLNVAYKILAVFAAFFFSVMLYQIMTVEDIALGPVELVAGTVLISISLIYDRDINPTTPKEAPK
jgi:hypothetical protein